MRNLVSGITAGVTALLLGTLIAGAADAARAAESAKQRDTTQAIVEDASADQASIDVAAYRAQLQQAMARLSAAYADLQARDAGYRELLATSQANGDRLQAANRQLQDQLAQASARLQAPAERDRASTTAAGGKEHHEDVEDDD